MSTVHPLFDIARIDEPSARTSYRSALRLSD